MDVIDGVAASLFDCVPCKLSLCLFGLFWVLQLPPQKYAQWINWITLNCQVDWENGILSGRMSFYTFHSVWGKLILSLLSMYAYCYPCAFEQKSKGQNQRNYDFFFLYEQQMYKQTKFYFFFLYKNSAFIYVILWKNNYIPFLKNTGDNEIKKWEFDNGCHTFFLTAFSATKNSTIR